MAHIAEAMAGRTALPLPTPREVSGEGKGEDCEGRCAMSTDGKGGVPRAGGVGGQCGA